MGADRTNLMMSDLSSNPTTTPVDPSEPAPLVSVLVRSLDRGFLQQALASVAAQTYTNLEVVVVAVSPGHSPVPDRVGSVPCRLIPAQQTRPRSVAANVALAQARGQWLLFLDDDDWLMPEHVARLQGRLASHPDALAAYTGVALVDREGHPRGQVLDLPFDAVRQRAGNLTPIHAVLFSRQLIDLGCRFDESLDRYEDWDFWLQVARQTTLLHLPGVSAAYRIHDSSGVHDDPGPLGQSSRRIYDKWAGLWSVQEIGEIMRRVWSHDEVDARRVVLEATLADSERRRAQTEATLGRAVATEAALQARLAQQASSLDELSHRLALQQMSLAQLAQSNERLSQQLAEQEHRLQQAIIDRQAVLDSSSWWVTRPLRWLAGMLGRSGSTR